MKYTMCAASSSSDAAAVRALLPSADLSALEIDAFLRSSAGNVAQAAGSLEAKLSWLQRTRVTIERVAPFYRSEGFSVVLEGHTDVHGDPVVFSNGILHGSVQDVAAQVLYTHERVLALCTASARPALRATTIVNVRNPTFRFPDAAARAAIALTGKHYPWSSTGTTVFVGFPAPVRWTFNKLSAFMSPEQASPTL